MVVHLAGFKRPGGGYLGGKTGGGGLNRWSTWDPTVGVLGGSRPITIGHRGSSGQLPDHTLAAYARAIEQGADCIECDMVVTKDLHVVCRHEPWLQNTTDACAKFPEYTKTYNLPEAGGDITGIFSVDLTLTQIKQLRAAQPLSFRNQGFNWFYQVPTFKEYISLARSANRTVCIYPETKHPKFFNTHPTLRNAGVTIDDLVMKELREMGYNLQAPINSRDWLRSPVFIQSFEQNNLKYWAQKTRLPVVQLVDDVPAADTGNTPEYLLSEDGIKEISKYAWGYAPWKGLYIVSEAGGIKSVNPQPIRLAAKYGMPTTAWTLRNEPSYLASQYNGNAFNEYNLIFNVLGVMGGFSDHPYALAYWCKSSQYKRAPPSVADQVAANPGNTALYANQPTPTWVYGPLMLAQSVHELRSRIESKTFSKEA
eukprot:gene14298-25_t